MKSTEFQDMEASVNLPPEPSESEILKSLAKQTPMEKVVGGVAAGSVGTSLVAMAVERSPIVVVAGLLSSIVGPFAFYQQTQLTEIKALQRAQTAVANEVTRLKHEHQRLETSVKTMGESVERLEDVRVALDTVTATQGQTIAEFAQQVNVNRENLKRMQMNAKNVVVQILIGLLERVDADGDQKVDEITVDEVLEQMQNLKGVQVKTDRFRTALSEKGVMHSLLNLLRNIACHDLPQEHVIFEFSNHVES